MPIKKFLSAVDGKASIPLSLNFFASLNGFDFVFPSLNEFYFLGVLNPIYNGSL